MTLGPPRDAEAELILSCTRQHLDAARVDRVRDLAGRALDWDFVVSMALRHHVAPLVHPALSLACPERVPPTLLEHLADEVAHSARRSRRLLEELLGLMRLFGAHGIAAVPYKGPVLAASTYGDVARRTFRDLDILVHRRDVMRAKDLLIGEGYRPIPHPTAANEAEALDVGYAWQFRRRCDDGETKVEVHWGFAPRYLHVGLDLGALSGRLDSISIAGAVLPRFSADDTLLTLCVHGCKDLWQRLQMVCDVAEVIGGPRPIDWDRLVGQAARLNIERMLLLGVRLARDLLDAAVPAGVSRRVDGDPAAHSLARKVRDRLFSETVEPMKAFGFYVELVQGRAPGGHFGNAVSVPRM